MGQPQPMGMGGAPPPNQGYRPQQPPQGPFESQPYDPVFGAFAQPFHQPLHQPKPIPVVERFSVGESLREQEEKQREFERKWEEERKRVKEMNKIEKDDRMRSKEAERRQREKENRQRNKKGGKKGGKGRSKFDEIPDKLPDTIMVPLEKGSDDEEGDPITLNDFQQQSYESSLAEEVIFSELDEQRKNEFGVTEDERALFSKIGFFFFFFLSFAYIFIIIFIYLFIFLLRINQIHIPQGTRRRTSKYGHKFCESSHINCR